MVCRVQDFHDFRGDPFTRHFHNFSSTLVDFTFGRVILHAKKLDARLGVTEAAFTTEIPMTFRRRGCKAVTVLTDGSRAIERREALIDNAMVKLLARGHRWQRMLLDGTHCSIDDLSRAEKITASYVSRVLRLAYLSPTIVEVILDGKYPAHLTLKDLMEPFPLEWGRQVAHFFVDKGMQ